ncbi:hypothetical protein [Prevotella melaninogenica]|jgi:hypothetical protein|uniref:hypothetical protein n=1 Tax=Prevotella melaninogenica TaxID=28132 RepID=UPI001C5DF614|nr:hypothetical protein [Prevotella melaninogenica]MBW4762007.1 hypothetical protein [Prevotella melaninogenica]MBW4879777.1 hypothetical protein [Prevotella melaninogenica]
MKKRILLPALCMAISIFTASCSSDDIESPEAKEQMVTLTVSAGTEDDAAATRAVLSEADAAKSPWKWEQGDKILLVSGNGSQKTVSTLSLKSMKRGGLGADFEGQVPASSVTNGSTYRFFYVGKTSDGRSDRSVDASTGSINIDLTQQTGNLADLKRNCVLTGTGKVVVSGNKATTDGNVKLANVFAVAHFAVTANNNTALTKIGLRGKGVYASANVDLSTGAVTGVSEIGTEVDPEENIFFPDGKTDFYVTFVPGTVAPAFDGYYADSYTSVVSTTPETRNYDADKSFVYYNGQKAKFSVSDNQRVAITNGNMQYVMPIATYTSAMNAKTLSANTLIRWKNSVPLKLKATYTVHAGHYRLAPEQWKTAMPKNTKAGGSYSYDVIKVGNLQYVSPAVYRYFDLPSWGTIDNPTVINNTFSIRGTGTETQYDFGNKLYVSSKKTRVMTSDEWAYLMPQNTNNSNNRIWIENGKKYAKWARCFIDENGDGKRGTNPAELRGYLIFPDDMTIDEARNAFTKTPTFGGGNAINNPTTYEKIKSSGAVFIPLSAYRSHNNRTLSVWGEHGNYSTSSYKNGSMVHIRITATSSIFSDTSDPNQGCMSRLVQNY